MWTFRRTRRPPVPQLRARLGLESLDLRLPPSSLLDPIADSSGTTLLQAAPVQYTAPTVYDTSDGGAGTVSDPTTGQMPAPVQTPTIVNFQGVEVVGGLWRFTGDVIAPAPGGLTVAFGGEPASLQGVTTTTDANGHFDMSKLMNTDGSDDGIASAQTADAAGNPSNIALYNITPS